MMMMIMMIMVMSETLLKLVGSKGERSRFPSMEISPRKREETRFGYIEEKRARFFSESGNGEGL